MHSIASNRPYLVCRRRLAMPRVGNVIGKTKRTILHQHTQHIIALLFDRCASWTKPNSQVCVFVLPSHIRTNLYIFQFVAIAFDLLKCIELGGERRVTFDTCNVAHFTFIKLWVSIPFESIWAVVLPSTVISVLSLWLIFPPLKRKHGDHVTADLQNLKFNIAVVCETCLHTRAITFTAIEQFVEKFQSECNSSELTPILMHLVRP